jgi:hypothetical protein
MAGKRKKRYVPRAVMSDPFAAFQPVDKERRDNQMLKFRTALESVARGSAPDEEDWRLLADAINVLETLIAQELLTAKSNEYLDAATAAMVEAGEGWRNGRGMRFTGAGLQSLRVVIDLYEQCLEQLTERQMDQARRETERRLRAIRLGQAGRNRKVVMV